MDSISKLGLLCLISLLMVSSVRGSWFNWGSDDDGIVAKAVETLERVSVVIIEQDGDDSDGGEQSRNFGDWPITFYLALKISPRAYQTLEQRVLNISNPNHQNYGQWMSVDEINQMLALPNSMSEKRQAIINSWLNDGGVDLGGVTWWVDAVRVQTNVSVTEKLLGVVMDVPRLNPRDGKLHGFYSSVDYRLPSLVRPWVEFIDGLIDPRHHPNGLPISMDPSRARVTRRGRNQLRGKVGKVGKVVVDPGYVTREVIDRIYQVPDRRQSCYVNDSRNIKFGMDDLNGSKRIKVGTDDDNVEVSLGPIEFLGQNGFSQSALVFSQTQNGVPANKVGSDHLIGRNGYPDTESMLDIQMMGDTAPANNQLWYIDSNYWIYGWAVDFFNRKDVPEVISLSWGWSESSQCTIILCNGTDSRQYVDRSNMELLKIAARGVTTLVSSGDAGSPGRTDESCNAPSRGNVGHINPVFPGGSPWVLSVGATYLVAPSGKDEGVAGFNYHTPVCRDDVPCANGTVEQGVSFEAVGWTSGAGFDHWSIQYPWQEKVVQNYLNSGVPLPDRRYFNSKGRAYPDVSAIGHNCAVYMGRFWTGVDGTSCSSPVMGSMIAWLNQHQKAAGRPVMGYVNPLIYEMAQKQPSTFHDITVGNSSCTEYECCGPQYGFVASPGWDAVTGWGTPNLKEMISYLDKRFTA